MTFAEGQSIRKRKKTSKKKFRNTFTFDQNSNVSSELKLADFDDQKVENGFFRKISLGASKIRRKSVVQIYSSKVANNPVEGVNKGVYKFTAWVREISNRNTRNVERKNFQRQSYANLSVKISTAKKNT